jgi:hypothetical protein
MLRENATQAKFGSTNPLTGVGHLRLAPIRTGKKVPFYGMMPRLLPDIPQHVIPIINFRTAESL